MFSKATAASDGFFKILPRKVTVSTNVKFLVKPQSESHAESKILRFIFIFVQFVLCLDFGFLNATSLKQRLCIKCFTLLESILIGGYLCGTLLLNRNAVLLWIGLEITVFYIFVLVTMSCKYTYSDFLSDMRAFDKEIKVDSSVYNLEFKIVLFFVAILTLTTISIILSFVVHSDSYKIKDILKWVFLITILHSNDFVRITYVFVFASAYWRIKKLLQFVKGDCADVTTCQYLYKNITDITENAKANYNFVFVVTLIFNSVVVTAIIFIPFIDSSVKQIPLMTLIAESIAIVRGILMMFAPTFPAGLLTAEVEKLVLVLRDKLLVTKEEETRNDMKRFINYIEARPMRFTVCNVITLDWNLPIIVINLAITYLIVMIQFTYK